MRVLIVLVFLVLTQLATCSQFQLPFKSEVSVKCVTPESMVEDSLSYKKDPVRVLVQLNDVKATHFMKFYNDLHEQTSRTTEVATADEIVVFDREGLLDVLITLYKAGCLVASSLMRGDYFNQAMIAIGADTRKPLKAIPSRLGERDV